MSDRIPFNPWSKDRIARNMKECTSRHKRYPKDPRVTYITPKLQWWFIKKYLYKPEGALSPAELQDVIEEIYDRPVHDNEEFYVHFGDFSDEAEQTRF